VRFRDDSEGMMQNSSINDQQDGQKHQIQYAYQSHIGASSRRELLEDRAHCEILRTAAGVEVTLGVVADGIGGENSGERAAQLTVNTIYQTVAKSQEKSLPVILQEALFEANRRVFSEARRNRRKMNMGSTAAVAAISNGQLYIANVGDSRIYLIREGQIIQLTIDHTWENEVVRTGRLTKKEAQGHPRKDEIVHSIGYEAAVKVDLGMWLKGGEENEAQALRAQGMPLKAGDRIFICSDGVTKSRHDNPSAHYVERDELIQLVSERAPRPAAAAVIKRALSRKVDDNVSAVILEVPGAVYKRRLSIPFRKLATIGVLAAVMAAVFWGITRFPWGNSFVEPEKLPELPSGVAYLAEIEGAAEKQNSDGSFVRLQEEEIIAAGAGVRLRTLGLNSYLKLVLADASVVYLGPETQIELSAIAGGTSGGQTKILLESGSLVSSTDDSSSAVFAVFSPIDATASLLGSVMGSRFDPQAQRFEIDCFHTRCAVSGIASINLQSGQSIWINKDGQTGEIAGVDFQNYSFGGYAGGLIPTAEAEDLPASIASSGGPTNTPLGSLFEPPTVTPTKRATQPPKPGQPADTPQPPTSTTAPSDVPDPTNTPWHRTATPQSSNTPEPAPTDPPPPSNTPEPAPTDPPPPTNTSAPAPTNTSAPAPTDASDSSQPTSTKKPTKTPKPKDA
jgi:PPM family protein phosphatase